MRLPRVAAVAAATALACVTSAGLVATPHALGVGLTYWYGTVTAISDGDTVYVDIAGDGKPAVPIRNSNIQATEIHGVDGGAECHAYDAAALMARLVPVGTRVRLAAYYSDSTAGTDPRGAVRYLRYVDKYNSATRLYDIDVQAALLSAGLVLWQPLPRETARQSAYHLLMQQAMTKRLGLFGSATCDGTRSVGVDFNGDQRSDVAVWRPSTGTWYVRGYATVQWGAAGDQPVAGDYDGDGRSDFAVWRPSNGTWYVRGVGVTAWGVRGDVPVPADFDGDGRMDLAVWRPSTGTWYVRGYATVQWGATGDQPAAGDYDGDGRSEFAVWRPSTGTWYVRGVGVTAWGVRGDVSVVGDFNGAFGADVTIFRPATGTWYVRGYVMTQWGAAGDQPVAGDYDGDGRSDLAVWRPSSGTWYIRGVAATTWGVRSDVPIRGSVLRRQGTGGTPATATAALRMWFHYDADGDDAVMNQEWVHLHNAGSSDLPLAGWRIRDASHTLYRGGPYFTFPAGTVVRAGQTLTIYPGTGTDDVAEGRFYLGNSTGNVFPNVSDPRVGYPGKAWYLLDPRLNFRVSADYPCMTACAAPPVRISRVQYTTSDEYVDLRLADTVTTPVDLTGVEVTNDGRTKELTPGTVLNPGETLRVFCERTGEDTRLQQHWRHTGGTMLEDSGDTVVLRTAESTVLSTYRWGYG